MGSAGNTPDSKNYSICKHKSARMVLENPEHLLHISSAKGLELYYWICSFPHTQDCYSAQRPCSPEINGVFEYFTSSYYGNKCGIKRQARHLHKSMIVRKLMPCWQSLEWREWKFGRKGKQRSSIGRYSTTALKDSCSQISS